MIRQRLTFSILLAVLIHAALLLLVQMFLRLAPERMPEYSGPLFVTIEERPESPVLERLQERQPEVQPAPQPVPEPQAQPAPQAAARAEQPRAAAQPKAQPQTVAPSSRQPTPGQTAPLPERQPQGTRQLVPAEPLGTLPPVAAEESTPYEPQSFTQPLQDQGPVQAAPSEEQRPDLDTSRLDTAIAQADRDGPQAAQAGPSGDSTGRPGTSPTSVEGFQIEWQTPSEGRQVLQSEQPSIPRWVSDQALRLQVAVSFVLGPSGYLSDIRIARSSGYSEVDSAVVAALRRWRFSASPGATTVRGEVTYRIIPR